MNVGKQKTWPCGSSLLQSLGREILPELGASQERSTLGYTCKHRVKYVNELLFKSLTFIAPTYNLLYYMAAFRIKKRLNVDLNVCMVDFQTVFPD